MQYYKLFNKTNFRYIMNIQQYFTRLNKESQAIFEKSILFNEQLGKAHHFASCIFEFSEYIPDSLEKNIF